MVIQFEMRSPKPYLDLRRKPPSGSTADHDGTQRVEYAGVERGVVVVAGRGACCEDHALG